MIGLHDDVADLLRWIHRILPSPGATSGKWADVRERIDAALQPQQGSLKPAEDVETVVRQTNPLIADYGDFFLVAHVSADGSLVGIDHPCDAVWADVMKAHVALRDRINERIEAQNGCPFKPSTPSGEASMSIPVCSTCKKPDCEIVSHRLTDWTVPTPSPSIGDADRMREALEPFAYADIDVSGTAAIGITAADILRAQDALAALNSRKDVK